VSDEIPKADIVVREEAADKPDKKSSITSLLLQAHQFSGPLPPPDVLDQYNKIHPGAADRIICMAEQQGEHRRHLEKVTIEADAFSEKIGPFLGFIIAMTVILGGIWLISRGLRAEGLAAVLAAVAAPVGLFIYGKRQQQRELESKRDEQPQKKKNSKRRRR